jgi:hypothetical protein
MRVAVRVAQCRALAVRDDRAIPASATTRAAARVRCGTRNTCSLADIRGTRHGPLSGRAGALPAPPVTQAGQYCQYLQPLLRWGVVARDGMLSLPSTGQISRQFGLATIFKSQPMRLEWAAVALLCGSEQGSGGLC